MNDKLKRRTVKYIDGLDGVTGYVLFAADWCMPCQRLKPHIVEDIDYIFDLTNDNPTDVRGVPTIRYYEDGNVKEEIVAPSPAAFKEWRGV